MTNADAIKWLENLKKDIGNPAYQSLWHYEQALTEIIEMLDGKDEPNSSEKPNNCEYAENPSGDVWECGCFLDTYCEHQIYDRNPDGTINIVECGYEPKDEPQMDLEVTRNSLRTDCTGCRFVGWYDTDFPCVNCVRKNKDYYDSE